MVYSGLNKYTLKQQCISQCISAHHIASGCLMNLIITSAVCVVTRGGVIAFLREHSHQHNPSDRTQHCNDLKHNTGSFMSSTKQMYLNVTIIGGYLI